MVKLKVIAVAAFLLACIGLQAQKDSTGGLFSLGMRSTISSFTDANSVGIGSGGQFLIRVARHVNTDWFADYINTNIEGLGYRRDIHIGWSVDFYLDKEPLQVHKVTPFLLAGQCFDYTNVYSYFTQVDMERWSAAAAQGGFGITYNLTRNFDFSGTVMYMMHLGTHVETQVEYTEQGQEYLNITKEPGASLDGHLLITLSVNYMLGKLQ